MHWKECEDKIRELVAQPGFYDLDNDNKSTPQSHRRLSGGGGGGDVSSNTSADDGEEEEEVGHGATASSSSSSSSSSTASYSAQAGSYPVYFDANFDEERSRRMLEILREGYFVEEAHTAEVAVEFLLYHQRTNTVSYVELTFTLDESGSVFLSKNIECFTMDPCVVVIDGCA
jgi:hypothetical protein